MRTLLVRVLLMLGVVSSLVSPAYASGMSTTKNVIICESGMSTKDQ